MPAKQVLVVDDDSMVRLLIPALLRERNFEIEQASDGDEALDKIRVKKFDVIVLDLIMPRVDGFEVLRHLRSAEPALLKRTIVLTGFAGATPEPIDESEIYKLVRKPFQMKDLAEMVVQCAADGAG
ncbi:MAG TPA: response regulator [Thermoanaerobaculia bacterium]|nr:response regulator [Thermoanaerobaculia bacterium]